MPSVPKIEHDAGASSNARSDGLLPELHVEELLQTQGPDSGIQAIRGQWPGEETDDEVFAALDYLS